MECHPSNHFVLGIYAFALVEVGEHDLALEHGKRGVELSLSSPYAQTISYSLPSSSKRTASSSEIGDPWSHHAVAHVYEEKGEARKGIEWMQKHAPCWDSCSSWMYSHNYWHLCIFFLEEKQVDPVLEMYDSKVWRYGKHKPQVQIGAAGLLWKMELLEE